MKFEVEMLNDVELPWNKTVHKYSKIFFFFYF